ncbi:MAG TPA: hypothetical protein VKW76_16325 [Candidatus Binatia bacterium]|nr:hypothetical protein [Candidatus Binatia bacterium]
MEVRRLSRDVTLRTPQGTMQHVVVPRAATVTGTRGQGLDGIRAGMTVRIVARRGSPRLVAREVVAHPTFGGVSRGGPASRRVAR